MKKQTFEVWKAIQGYEGLYEVSNWGRVMDAVRNFEYKATNISYCALGKRKLAYDYVWKYPI